MASTVVPAVLNIQGIRLVNLAMEEVLSAIESALFARQPTRISFVNDDCINIAARDANYRAALADTEWLLIDGVGMRIAGKLLSQPVRENINCTDLFPYLCATLARQCAISRRKRTSSGSSSANLFFSSSNSASRTRNCEA